LAATGVQDAIRLIQGGERAAAVAVISALLATRPALNDLWLPLANAALGIGEMSLAEAAARNYLAVNKQQTQRLVQYAGVLAETGKLDKALKLVRPQLKKNPDDAALNHFCGTVYQQQGELSLAAKHLRRALKSARLSGASWLTLAAQHRFTENDALLDRLRLLAADFAQTEPFNQVQYHFALGKALLDVSEDDLAFDEFSAGAVLAPGRRNYNAAGEAAYVDAVIAGHAKLPLPRASESEDNPAIFLLGMPRSGTTLLQRILSAARNIADGGEFAGIGVASMDYRRALASGGAPTLDEVHSNYLHVSKERFGGNSRIVDKSINNLYYAGIIAHTFPAAPIILLERNARDVAWSCFRTCFNRGMHWSWALDDIGAHLRAEQRLMEHWKTVMPERLIVVQYERLVREPQQVLPDLFARCGLEFGEHVYNFYQRKSPVMTASVAQVNRALNANSIGSAARVAHRLIQLGDI